VADGKRIPRLPVKVDRIMEKPNERVKEGALNVEKLKRQRSHTID